MICELTPLIWFGKFKIASEPDGTVHNAFANYFPDERIRHLWLVSINDNYAPDTVMIAGTRDLDNKYCFATYLDIVNEVSGIKRFKKIYGEKVIEEITLEVNKGESINLIKYIVVEDTRHVREEELIRVTTNILNQNKITNINDIREAHKKAWEDKWNIA